MTTKVHMEALSPTMEEGQLVRWVKAEGDDVANGDVLAEIEADKATMELVARGEVWPLVSDIRPLEEAEELHQRIEDGKVIGRAALLIS